MGKTFARGGAGGLSGGMEFPARAVALLRTPFGQKFGVPRQSGLVEEAEGIVEFLPAFAAPEFTRGLEGFSHVWLLTWFHANDGWTGAATVRPPRLGGDERVGVFASRSPNRPTPIGLSLVRLLGVEPGRLRVAGVDAVDGTPVLDVKPYVPWAEARGDAHGSWAARPPEPRPPEAVVVSAGAEECIKKMDTDGGRATLALVRAVLRHDLHPAYQDGPGRIYGVLLNGWDVRYRIDGGGVLVIEALRAAK
jgi:tRNA-Thr(GGU) m(6)t(6)A37 methyltransferase TsaA